MQMGVEVDALTDPVPDAVRAQLENVTEAPRYTGPYTRDVNASFRMMNRALAGKETLAAADSEKLALPTVTQLVPLKSMTVAPLLLAPSE